MSFWYILSYCTHHLYTYCMLSEHVSGYVSEVVSIGRDSELEVNQNLNMIEWICELYDINLLSKFMWEKQNNPTAKRTTFLGQSFDIVIQMEYSQTKTGTNSMLQHVCHVFRTSVQSWKIDDRWHRDSTPFLLWCIEYYLCFLAVGAYPGHRRPSWALPSVVAKLFEPFQTPEDVKTPSREKQR